MSRGFFRLMQRYRYIRAILFLVFLLFAADIPLLSWSQFHQHVEPASHQSSQRLFVASIHWNNEAILRDHWNEAVVKLVRLWGSDRIYVSVYESGSWDDSKGALKLLDGKLKELGVSRKIVLDETSHATEVAKIPSSSGWIETPRGRRELRRIPYLSKLRNASLQPLAELASQGIKFDKILFLNDVVFEVYQIPQS